ncbi:hypothetical protein [Planctomicrobium sp. SH664]|uniref:hypothetical protein n=1 Tax=Planctomicrobium sp. SH664 TaxID=3448125 RepID=UPI003F5BD909
MIKKQRVKRRNGVVKEVSVRVLNEELSSPASTVSTPESKVEESTQEEPEAATDDE